MIDVLAIIVVMCLVLELLHSLRGMSVTKFLVCLTMLILLGVGLIAKTPQQPRVMTLDKDCVVYLPHSDYQAEGDFNKWMASLPTFTNLDFTNGEWVADGKVVAYGDAEDAAVTNGKCDD